MSNVIICPHNRNVQNLNEKIADALSTTEYVSYSADKGMDQSVDLGKEVLNTLELPRLPSHELKFKEKMPVMLMRNVSKEKNFVMGQG